MKRLATFALLLLAVAGRSALAAPEAPVTEAEAQAVLRQVAEAWRQEDLGALLALQDPRLRKTVMAAVQPIFQSRN